LRGLQALDARRLRHRVALGGLRGLRIALAERDFALAARLCQTTSGGAGRIELFACPRCGAGYLDLTAEFRTVYRAANGTGESNAAWLVASTELGAAETELFQPNRK
jgi:hypothetical protein